MGTDSFLATMLVALVALFFGWALSFAGYKLFLILLPIWGFVFGFVLGGQTVTAISGDAFLATVTGWVIGFVLAVIFAALSYLFYFVAVGLIAGSLGYMAAISLLSAIGIEFGFIAWIIGLIAAVALIIVTYALNLQKWVIMIATAVLGAGVIVWTILLMFYPAAQVMTSPVKTALDNNIILLILFVVVAIAGLAAQYRNTRKMEIAMYNNWDEYA
jgi:hypothetical protein